MEKEKIQNFSKIEILFIDFSLQIIFSVKFLLIHFVLIKRNHGFLENFGDIECEIFRIKKIFF